MSRVLDKTVESMTSLPPLGKPAQEELELLGRFPTGTSGIFLRAFSLSGALFLVAIEFTGDVDLTLILITVLVMAILWIGIMIYRLPVLRKLLQVRKAGSALTTESITSIWRHRVKNLVILVGGFFGPLILIFILPPPVWLATMLSAIAGVVGGELTNAMIIRYIEHQRGFRLTYYVVFRLEGLKPKPFIQGILAVGSSRSEKS